MGVGGSKRRLAFSASTAGLRTASMPSVPTLASRLEVQPVPR